MNLDWEQARLTAESTRISCAGAALHEPNRWLFTDRNGGLPDYETYAIAKSYGAHLLRLGLAGRRPNDGDTAIVAARFGSNWPLPVYGVDGGRCRWALDVPALPYLGGVYDALRGEFGRAAWRLDPRALDTARAIIATSKLRHLLARATGIRLPEARVLDTPAMEEYPTQWEMDLAWCAFRAAYVAAVPVRNQAATLISEALQAFGAPRPRLVADYGSIVPDAVGDPAMLDFLQRLPAVA